MARVGPQHHKKNMEEDAALLIRKLKKTLNFGGEASSIVAILKNMEMRYTTKMNLCL
jgi:hypothetical protein